MFTQSDMDDVQMFRSEMAVFIRHALIQKCTQQNNIIRRMFPFSDMKP